MQRATAATNTSPTTGQVFVARQGVFDHARRVVGYEMLLDRTSEAEADASLDRSSARVISNAIVAVGLDTLAGGSRAFVTVSRRLLVEGLPDVLPPSRVVVQLGADIEADGEVVGACQALRAAGYALAIDDFSLNPWTEDLVPCASFVKVSMGALDGETRSRILNAEAAGGPALVVKDVDSMAAFEAMAAGGCRYFQGAFLGQPVVKQGRTTPVNQLTYLRLLQALNNPNLSLDELEELVKHDAALCFRILQTVNSAAFAVRSTITSIRQALLMLGRDTIRRWASLWGLAAINERAHAELVATATVRGRSCEMMAEAIDEDLAQEGFLTGLCSVLDAMLERPMNEVLEGMPVAPAVKAALMGTDGTLRQILDCAIAYERGHWQRAVDLAVRLRLDPKRLPAAYEEALRWSRELDKQRTGATPVRH